MQRGHGFPEGGQASCPISPERTHCRPLSRGANELEGGASELRTSSRRYGLAAQEREVQRFAQNEQHCDDMFPGVAKLQPQVRPEVLGFRYCVFVGRMPTTTSTVLNEGSVRSRRDRRAAFAISAQS